MKRGHRCSNFWNKGLICPIQNEHTEEEEDDEDAFELFPASVPGMSGPRKKHDFAMAEETVQVPAFTDTRIILSENVKEQTQIINNKIQIGGGKTPQFVFASPVEDAFTWINQLPPTGKSRLTTGLLPTRTELPIPLDASKNLPQQPRGVPSGSSIPVLMAMVEKLYSLALRNITASSIVQKEEARGSEFQQITTNEMLEMNSNFHRQMVLPEGVDLNQWLGLMSAVLGVTTAMHFVSGAGPTSSQIDRIMRSGGRIYQSGGTGGRGGFLKQSPIQPGGKVLSPSVNKRRQKRPIERNKIKGGFESVWADMKDRLNQGTPQMFGGGRNSFF